jgi:DNA (cytosine-5)-methyltransferase 1
VQGTPLDAAAGTVTTVDHHAIVAAHLLHLHGTSRDGRPVDAPTPTVLAQGTHIAEVRTLLERFGGGPVDAVVRIGGELWQVVDIGMRMLTARRGSATST